MHSFPPADSSLYCIHFLESRHGGRSHHSPTTSGKSAVLITNEKMEEKQPGLALSELPVALLPIEKEECCSYFIFLRINSHTLPLLPELSYTWFSPYKTRQKKAN